MVLTWAMRARVPEDVLVQELHGEAVLLNVRTGCYFGLDPVGARMWAAVTAAPHLGAARDALLAEYEVEAERLQNDLQVLVGRLVEHGLLEVGDG